MDSRINITGDFIKKSMSQAQPLQFLIEQVYDKAQESVFDNTQVNMTQEVLGPEV